MNVLAVAIVTMATMTKRARSARIAVNGTALFPLQPLTEIEPQMKLLSHHKEMIQYLFTKGWASPLEIAEEMGLTFKQVCGYIGRACLRNIIIHVAVGVEKATRAAAYPAQDYGFTPPNWRQRCS